MKKKFKLVLLVVSFFLYPNLSYAYLDPGTGNILLQAILGGVAIALTTIQIWWYKIKILISKIFKKFNKKT